MMSPYFSQDETCAGVAIYPVSYGGLSDVFLFYCQGNAHLLSVIPEHLLSRPALKLSVVCCLYNAIFPEHFNEEKKIDLMCILPGRSNVSIVNFELAIIVTIDGDPTH